MRIGLPQRSRWKDPEERAYTLVFIAFAWIAALGFGLVSIAMVVGIATGTAVDGLEEPNDEFPGFPLLSPTMVVPAVLIAAALIVSFTLPLKKAMGLNRSEIVFSAFMGVTIQTVMLGLDQRYLTGVFGWLAVAAWLLFLAVFAAAVLRMVAGWLRLVPESWRSEAARTGKGRGRPTRASG
ncbi:hypothetical protein [Demequina aestuarii]|uniref:hypothetical protein n=1 Tax=Demequina aestuarii TaxID=327095 RepID=UPI0007867295|nr:hypothetical protein [Demequina aestuarii]